MTVFDVLLDFLDSEGKLLPTGIERVGYLFVEDQGKKVHGEGVELAVEVHAKLFFLVVVAGWVQVAVDLFELCQFYWLFFYEKVET